MDRSDLERYYQPFEKLQQWLEELWAANQTEKNERTWKSTGNIRDIRKSYWLRK